jgi:hypothetical protein
VRAYPLRGEVGGGWAVEFESFLGPVKWHRADRRVPFGAQKSHIVLRVNSLRYFFGVPDIDHAQMENFIHVACKSIHFQCIFYIFWRARVCWHSFAYVTHFTF